MIKRSLTARGEEKNAVMPSGCLCYELPQGQRTVLGLIHFWHTALSWDILVTPDNQVGIRAEHWCCWWRGHNVMEISHTLISHTFLLARTPPDVDRGMDWMRSRDHSAFRRLVCCSIFCLLDMNRVWNQTEQRACHTYCKTRKQWHVNTPILQVPLTMHTVHRHTLNNISQ